METLDKTAAGQTGGKQNGSGQYEVPKVKRPTLDDMDLSIGKKTRLYRILYEHGPGNGTMLLLPIDQGRGHGPGDFGVYAGVLERECQSRRGMGGGV